ncbi:hypothetical protein PybrP1_008407 [[Pythium] brassicae (nom. inval.)]|nr:hypothetical protein PybrP1_008407 [[Pythium] brassicae (nom. inval.)]
MKRERERKRAREREEEGERLPKSSVRRRQPSPPPPFYCDEHTPTNGNTETRRAGDNGTPVHLLLDPLTDPPTGPPTMSCVARRLGSRRSRRGGRCAVNGQASRAARASSARGDGKSFPPHRSPYRDHELVRNGLEEVLLVHRREREADAREVAHVRLAAGDHRGLEQLAVVRHRGAAQVLELRDAADERDVPALQRARKVVLDAGPRSDRT